MKLIDIIPDNNPNWSIKSEFIRFKKLENIPVCYIDNDIVYILLDCRIPKQISKLTSFLIDKGIKFFFTTPEVSNPGGVLDIQNKVIHHYLLSNANKFIRKEFKKIEFNLIDNMVKWCEHENCFHLVKPALKIVKKKIEENYYDYHSKMDIWSYRSEIRDEYNSMYRDIILSRIL